MSEQGEANEPEACLVFESDLDESCEKVWKALTKPELLAAWLMANDFEPQASRRFTFRGDRKQGEPEKVDCQLLELDPPHRLTYSWRESGPGAATQAPSIVTFVLTPLIHGGTRLRLIHRADEGARFTSHGGFRCAA